MLVLAGSVQFATATGAARPEAAREASYDRVFVSFSVPSGELSYALIVSSPDDFRCKVSRITIRIPEAATDLFVDRPGFYGRLCANRRYVPVTVHADVPQADGPAGASAVVARVHYKTRQRDHPAWVTVRLAPASGQACAKIGRVGTPVRCRLRTPGG